MVAKLRADIVVAVKADGEYAQDAARVALQTFLGDHGVFSFFRTDEAGTAPSWATALVGDLKLALDPAFPETQQADPLGAEAKADEALEAKVGKNATDNDNAAFAALINQEKERAEMSTQDKGGAEGPPMIQHIYYGPVSVANGDHAQQAGRDIINHAPATWQAVGVSFEALREAIAALPDATPQKKQLLADFEDVHEVVKTGKPDEGQAKLVKRCLDGLKQGAEAVENGSTIVEKLAPAAMALAAAWPGIVSWIS